MTGPGAEHVDYSAIDPFTLEGQRAAASTDGNIERLGLQVVRESRGESVLLVSTKTGETIDLVGALVETLGTKNLVADSMRSSTGKTYYDAMAQDTIAMVVNDVVTLGTVPVLVGPLITAGADSWFKDEQRSRDLIDGWRSACNLARAVYGPGESAALSGLVSSDSAVLSGFAYGVPARHATGRVSGRVEAGDTIVFFASSGIHANGLTNARALASNLPEGYTTRLDDGQMYGEALLVPTPIYVPIIEDCLIQGVDLHYCVNVTGHGWRKLMRARSPLRYVVDHPPPVPAVLQFIVEASGITDEGAYGTFNMGAGYAVYVDDADANTVIEVAASHGIQAWSVGFVENADDRSVEIPALSLRFSSDTLRLR
jgi:phosphoribosylformylglycinamidine cyclo-ligase